MHYLYYVAVPKKGQTSEEAKNLTNRMLEMNNFAGEGGFWNNNKANWYVIGGRWSGHLQKIQLDNFNDKATELIKSKRTTEEEKARNSIGNIECEEYNTEIQILWEKLGGTGANPWSRDNYNHDGAKDDSMLLNENLFKALKAGINEKTKDPFDDETETEVALIDENEYIDDEIKLSEFLEMDNIIGNYYLIVIDYHN